MHSEDFRYLESRVKAQYEAFPYPDIETANRNGTALAAMPSDLFAINHYLFAGFRDFSLPFRVLVAGGGTGIATVRLAQQLQRAGCPSKLVYLDLSEESRRIAERRAQSLGLDNIDFHTGSLIDLPSLGLGVFDYIDCGGVLHHLKEPAAGLTALTEVMAAEGGMGLMVYGPYGRAGIYPIQEMMRRLGAGNQSDQLPLLKKVLDGLPATNLLHHHERFRQGYGENDAELVDLFLHPVDRPFTVPQLTQLCERAGLRVVRFLPTAKYEPASYIGVAEILRRVSDMEWLERAALAELLSGNMHMHFFFAVRSENFEEGIVDIERPDIVDFVPVLRDIDGAVLAEKLSQSNDFAYNFDGTSVVAEITDGMRALIAEIDGHRTLEEIYMSLAGKSGSLDWLSFRATYFAVHRILHDLLYGLFLRKRG
tara:strand:+ start:2326 stop:3597 length:1272 start_codon:yes stop_codon:yes gene_type:complete